MITLQELLAYFNLAGVVSPSQEDFDRALQVALDRFKALLHYDYPATPSALEKELLLHLTLIEMLKGFNYLWEEGKTRFSVKKVSSAAERIAWQIKASQTQTS